MVVAVWLLARAVARGCGSVPLWLCAPWPRKCPHVVRSGRSGLILICRIPGDLVLRASNLKGAAFRTRNHL